MYVGVLGAQWGPTRRGGDPGRLLGGGDAAVSLEGCFFMQEWMQALPGPQNSGPHLALGSDLPLTLCNTCRQPRVLILTPAEGSPSLQSFFSRSVKVSGP
ncbi:unnamed protein product [Rangifer tarandus platyrhynchus]|uniref:Uncharacterized protein n=1 Tax=Rangifer tarandus platyrhynchus TaxID=3082113 RepID=A0AC60A8Z3_RANTA